LESGGLLRHHAVDAKAGKTSAQRLKARNRPVLSASFCAVIQASSAAASFAIALAAALKYSQT
jgi:hypothetical protein